MNPSIRGLGSLLLALLFGLRLTACKPHDEGASSVAPSVSGARPKVCERGGGEIDDPNSAAFFDRRLGDYCVDPNGETRVYGQQAPLSLDEGCAQLFYTECDAIKSMGLERIVTLRYVDDAGSPGFVSIALATFSTEAGAYAFFTRRVLGDADPLGTSQRPLAAGTVAALGNATASVLRGQHVAELRYVNELETSNDLAAIAARTLPPFAVRLGSKLPGTLDLPLAAALLPEQDRVPFGVSYQFEDALGIRGIGAAAVGFYKNGERRWRVLSLARADAESAKDVATTLERTPGYAKLKDAPFHAFRLLLDSTDRGVKIEWLLARADDWVWGVGDEEYALDSTLSAAEQTARKLDLDEKQRVLKELMRISSQRSKSAQH